MYIYIYTSWTKERQVHDDFGLVETTGDEEREMIFDFCSWNCVLRLVTLVLVWLTSGEGSGRLVWFRWSSFDWRHLVPRGFAPACWGLDQPPPSRRQAICLCTLTFLKTSYTGFFWYLARKRWVRYDYHLAQLKMYIFMWFYEWFYEHMELYICLYKYKKSINIFI